MREKSFLDDAHFHVLVLKIGHFLTFLHENSLLCSITSKFGREKEN
jgi:hypothetical protein